MVDTLRDLEIDENRDIIVNGSNDLKLTEGEVNIRQSVSINVSNEVKDLLGRALTGAVLEELSDVIRQALIDDVQVGEVEEVQILTIDKVNNRVEVRAVAERNQDFTIDLI